MTQLNLITHPSVLTLCNGTSQCVISLYSDFMQWSTKIWGSRFLVKLWWCLRFARHYWGSSFTKLIKSNSYLLPVIIVKTQGMLSVNSRVCIPHASVFLQYEGHTFIFDAMLESLQWLTAVYGLVFICFNITVWSFLDHQWHDRN